MSEEETKEILDKINNCFADDISSDDFLRIMGSCILGRLHFLYKNENNPQEHILSILIRFFASLTNVNECFAKMNVTNKEIMKNDQFDATYEKEMMSDFECPPESTIMYFCLSSVFDHREHLTTHGLQTECITKSKDKARQLKKVYGWKVYACPVIEMVSFDE